MNTVNDIPSQKKKKAKIKVLTGDLNMLPCFFHDDDNGNVDDGMFLEFICPVSKRKLDLRSFKDSSNGEAVKEKLLPAAVLINFPFLHLLPSMYNIPPPPVDS